MPDTLQEYARYEGLNNVQLDDTSFLRRALRRDANRRDPAVYCFTLHEIFYEEGIFKQTRSSPNWQGDVCTMATCKHQMRSWLTPDDWLGKWCLAVTPRHCADNSIFFAGRVDQTFASNYDYGAWTVRNKKLYAAKRADRDPRGDVYLPRKDRNVSGELRYYHGNFHEPPNHTRSLETYSDGTPKWWKDIDYKLYERRPPVLLFRPAIIFSRPQARLNIPLGRAVRKLTCRQLLQHLEID